MIILTVYLQELMNYPTEVKLKLARKSAFHSAIGLASLALKWFFLRLIIVLFIVFVPFAAVYAGSYNDFFAAIRADDVDTVSNLLSKGFDPNAPTEDGQTPLIAALKAGAEKTTRLLINTKGVDIERTNLNDETALMLASINGNVEIIKLLIQKGAEVNKPGWTPLHYAATKGDLGTLKLLISQSAYLDAESPNGTTPLMMAAKYGTYEAVRLLIEEGADPTLRNNLKLNATDFAEMTANAKLISYLKTQTSIWILSHP